MVTEPARRFKIVAETPNPRPVAHMSARTVMGKIGGWFRANALAHCSKSPTAVTA